jgi:hypothetical protein
LEAVKCDLIRDLGRTPKLLSGMNFIAAIVTMLDLFHLMEGELDKRRNPLYVSVYEGNPSFRGNKREALVLRALERSDEECVRVLADAFQRYEVGIRQHFFDKEELDFGDLSFGGNHTTDKMDEETGANLCLVM